MSFDPSATDLTVEQVEMCNKVGVTVPAVREEWKKFPDATFEVIVGNVLAHQQHIADGVADAPVPETAPVEPVVSSEVAPVEPLEVPLDSKLSDAPSTST